MNEITVEAIVIGSTQINEKDKMIKAISEEGYLSFFAKGVSQLKSKNAPSLNVFSKSTFVLFKSSQNNYSLKTGILRKQYFSMSSYNQLAICSLMEEICKIFINENSSSDSYFAIEKALEKILDGEDPMTIGAVFLCTMLKNEGSFSLTNIFKNNKNKIEFTNALLEKTSNFNYKKEEIIDILINLIDYIQTSFNITLRTKDLIKVI